MTRLVGVLLVVLTAGAGCNKPSDENCRKAIANMQALMGTEHLLEDEGIESEVRRCKGGSSRESVDCAIKATTLEELRACGFATIPDKPVVAPTGSAGSAAAGSGSAAGSGDATGSAAGSGDATGSAAGSGDATGSGAGSGDATGSGAGSGDATGSTAGSGAAAAGSGDAAAGSGSAAN